MSVDQRPQEKWHPVGGEFKFCLMVSLPSLFDLLVFIFFPLSLSLSLSPPLSPGVVRYSSSLSAEYNGLVDTGRLNHDEEQFRVVQKLEGIRHQLMNEPNVSTTPNLLNRVCYSVMYMYMYMYMLHTCTYIVQCTNNIFNEFILKFQCIN